MFDSKGDLTIAGVTNKVSMPVNVFVMPDKKLKIVGTTPVKTTDYKVDPATFILPQFKTSPDVTVKFTWMLAQKKPAAAAAGK